MTGLFRRQKDNKHYQSGYRVENIRSNGAVIINEHSVLVGDIFAPQIIVIGMVYGYVVAREVVVEPSGQIWGDICAVSTVTRPGSKVHGWISSLDAGTIDLVRLGQLEIEDVPRSGQMATSAEKIAELKRYSLQTDQQQDLYSERVEIWRALRSEAATAISARSELEQTFERDVLETVRQYRINEQDPETDHSRIINQDRTGVGVKTEEGEAVKIPLSEAENEIRLLKNQLDSVLQQQSTLHNELIWTKALLLEARRQRSNEGINDSARDIVGIGMERSQHLASLKATIVERDLKLQELQATIDTREEQLVRLKTLAARRIEFLEFELNKIQRQNR